MIAYGFILTLFICVEGGECIASKSDTDTVELPGRTWAQCESVGQSLVQAVGKYFTYDCRVR